MPVDEDSRKKSIIKKINDAKGADGWFLGIVRCPNKNCITFQQREPAEPKFRLVRAEPITVQCYYCGRYIEENLVISQIS